MCFLATFGYEEVLWISRVKDVVLLGFLATVNPGVLLCIF